MAGPGPVFVAIPGMKAHFHGLAGQFKSDGVTEKLSIGRFDSADALRDFIGSQVPFFTGNGNSSLIAFLSSVVLTRGLSRIKGKISATWIHS